MCALTDLPLFSGVPTAAPPPKKKRRRERRTLMAELVLDYVEPPALSMSGSAVLLPFPPSRDTRLIADLAQAFIALRDRHGRQCRVTLLDKRFRPIATKLRRMAVPAAEIEAELALLEGAVARVVWIHDGRPSLGSGGGSEA